LQPGHLQCAPNGGELTGPNPTDRGKPGSTYHLLVDRNGIPLTVGLSAANTHDSALLESMVDALAPVTGLQGRPGRPASGCQAPLRHGYDYPTAAGCCAGAGSARGSPVVGWSPTPGWAVTDTSWSGRWRGLVGYRRLQVRYERRADPLLGFLYFARALICLKSMNQPKE
jgi:hypothetical protein